MIRKNSAPWNGFTLVELLIVVAVIAILATIATVAYVGGQGRAREAVLTSDLSVAVELLETDKVRNNTYPNTLGDVDKGNGIPVSTDTSYQYTVNNAADPKTFCLTGINGSVAMYTTESASPQNGICPGHDGPVIEG